MEQVVDISFITVNFNGLADTKELLLSIEKYLNGLFEYETIVVDNGSKTDETVSLRHCFPEVTFIRSERNLGFAGGNNLGIAASSGRYIMLINNDTLLIDESVSSLIKFMDENKEIAATSPKIYYTGMPRIIQYAGFTPFSKITLRNRSVGYNELDAGQHNTPSETFATHGAAMIVRRDVIERIGNMPEIYFLYYEELDWCMKMKRYGYKLWYQPSAVIVHKESQSTGMDSPLKRFYMTRNRLLFTKRNITGFNGWISRLYQILIACPKAMLYVSVNARFDLLHSIIKGIMAYFKISDKFEGVR